MSLLAATIGLDKAALAVLVGASNIVDVYSVATDSNVTAALNAATDQFRSAAIKGGYSSASVDALTSSTTPDSVKRQILHLALDELTSGGQSRPDSIGVFGAEARKWLSRLAGGAETIDGLSRETSTGGAVARIGAPASRIFDREDTSGDLRYRVVKI